MSSIISVSDMIWHIYLIHLHISPLTIVCVVLFLILVLYCIRIVRRRLRGRLPALVLAAAAAWDRPAYEVLPQTPLPLPNGLGPGHP